MYEYWPLEKVDDFLLGDEGAMRGRQNGFRTGDKVGDDLNRVKGPLVV